MSDARDDVPGESTGSAQSGGRAGSEDPTLPGELLEILACPAEDHGKLSYDAGAATLTCASCGREFSVVDGVPVLLLDEATSS